MRLVKMHTPGALRESDLEEMLATAPQSVDGHSFYRSTIDILRSEGLDFLVGGAYAMRVYADVYRDTKDFDVFVRPQDVDKVIAAFRSAGFCAGYAFSHWLAKVHAEGRFVDVIFRAGNGLGEVDDEWFTFASEAEIFGVQLPICPAEEMIWQKAYVMERERFDGADVLHLLRSCGSRLDWERLLRRFGEDQLVLLSHLVLFKYAYPSECEAIPRWVMERLASALVKAEPPAGRICRGTLLSRLQYLDDIEKWGYTDPRSESRVSMSEAEVRLWTQEARDQAALPGK